MLAKLTSKNQLTLPKAVVGQFPGARYFEVRAAGARADIVAALESIARQTLDVLAAGRLAA